MAAILFGERRVKVAMEVVNKPIIANLSQLLIIIFKMANSHRSHHDGCILKGFDQSNHLELHCVYWLAILFKKDDYPFPQKSRLALETIHNL